MNKILPTSEQRTASTPSLSAWVSANAGSGKTHVLIDRVARLMLAGAEPQSILCLTYTKAAAAQMSTRLFGKLSSWIGLDDAALAEVLGDLGETDLSAARLKRARQLFAHAIETPGGLKIQTIHAFCEKLLQLFPVEAGLAPGFGVMDESQKRELLQRCYDEALSALAEDDPDSALALLDDGAISGSDRFDALAAKFLSGNSVFRPLMTGTPVDIGPVLRVAVGLAPEQRPGATAAFLHAIDRTMLAQAAAAMASVPPFRKHDVGQWLRQAVQATDTETLDAALLGLSFTKKDSGREPRGEIFSKDTKTQLPSICAWIDELRSGFVAARISDALLGKIAATEALVALMREVSVRFDRAKLERGLYDFDDLINRAQALLSGSRAAQWVLYKLDANLAHVLIDEAQDTSPPQWAIIAALAEEFFAGQGVEKRATRTVFAVGDIKQSIYSFQGADTGAFLAAQTAFRARAAAAGLTFEDVNLTVSYRTVPEILRIVDTVFKDGAVATAGLGTGEGAIHQAKRSTARGRFELWPVLHPDKSDEPENWRAPVDHVSHDSHRRRLAQFIAAKVKSWIGQRKLGPRARAIAAGDILLLFQRRGVLFDAVIAALRAAGVPVAGADRLKLSENLAVQDLLALAQASLMPEDDLALACVLKSPLVPQPLSEDDLIVLSAQRGRTSLWQRLTSTEGQTLNAALLSETRRLAGSDGPFDFFARVLARSRKAMVERLGPEAQDATDVFLDLARDFEQQQGASLAGFVHWFTGRDEDHKRELEQAGGEVRLMTVHGAKGLEARIVILPDAADPPSPPRDSILRIPLDGRATLPLFDAPTDVRCEALDVCKEAEKLRLRHENKRLLYVALTRAEDELYVCGSTGLTASGAPRNLNEESWYALVDEAVRGDPALGLQPVDIGHPQGPALRLGAADEAAHAAAVAPNQDTLLPPWLLSHATPDQPIGTVQALSRLGRDENSAINRRAAARGTAIHRFLELYRPGSTSAVQRLAARLGLEESLAAQLAELVDSGMLGPFFGPAARAEASVHGVIAGIGPVEGQIDRLHVTPDVIWLLDYKSGSPANQAARTSYLRQMAGYAAILAAAYPGHEIRPALLWTQAGRLEWLESQALSQALDEFRAAMAAAPA
ncbi:MAG: double-strand break repair helicase AddA [Proteobacteria bacterium]|nr:double-strand break repair helicase AddA [Pseudomonadota bacterium]